jgi:hypothetical protein
MTGAAAAVKRCKRADEVWVLWRKGRRGTHVPNWFERVAVKDQVHIRNAEAAHLARALARQTGKTISEIVLDALRQYRPGRHAASSRRRVEHWQRLLADDRQQHKLETPIEALYDQVTGLPK